MGVFEKTSEWGKASHGKCSFCGGQPTGYWVGRTEIFVCRTCATEILPALFADALWYPRLTTDQGNYALMAFTAAYWKAIASEHSYALRESHAHGMLPDVAGYSVQEPAGASPPAPQGRQCKKREKRKEVAVLTRPHPMRITRVSVHSRKQYRAEYARCQAARRPFFVVWNPPSRRRHDLHLDLEPYRLTTEGQAQVEALIRDVFARHQRGQCAGLHGCCGPAWPCSRSRMLAAGPLPQN
jgi:hypothetical protein